MPRDDELQRILDDFMQSASPAELQELQELMNERKRNIGGRINVRKLALDMAEQIKRDIGLTQRNLKGTARRLVADLALQYNPEMSPEELRRVVDQMAPPEMPLHRRIPLEVLFAMLDQFVAFSEGTMPPEKAASFPPGWQKKYWAAFSPAMKRVLGEYLGREIDRDEFWRRIRSVFREMRGGGDRGRR
ncbi:MAG: hypothetical protein JXA20_14410 [Spirochaetes bacterium]|nr:hypothetical protein [Spirochaetota bacterium]